METAAAAAAAPESGLTVETLWATKSPHRWFETRRRAGAYVKARAFIVRLEAAHAAGDQAVFETLLRLNVEAVSGGRRSKFVGIIHTYCSDAVQDAVLELALASRLPLQADADAVGGDVAFWHALLHQVRLEAVKALIDGGLDVTRLRLNDDIDSLALGEAVDKLDETPAAVGVVAYLAGLGVFDLTAGNFWGLNPFTSALRSRRLDTARVLHAAGGRTTHGEWDINESTKALCRWINESPEVVGVLHGELEVDIAALGHLDKRSTAIQELAGMGSLHGLQALVAAVELPHEQVKAAALIACVQGNEAMLFLLLDHMGASIDDALLRRGDSSLTMEMTPLAVAISARQFVLARALLRRGANPKCGEGNVVMFMLAADGNVEGMRLLMDVGGIGEGEVDCHIRVPTVQRLPGQAMSYVALPVTPLQGALRCGAPGMVSMVSFLLARGADPAHVQAFSEEELRYKPALRAALERIQEAHRLRLILKSMVCLDPASTIVAARRAAGAPAPQVEVAEGEAPSREQQVFKAVVGHVVGGGLLPEHCQELMDLLRPTWMVEEQLGQQLGQQLQLQEQGQGQGQEAMDVA